MADRNVRAFAQSGNQNKSGTAAERFHRVHDRLMSRVDGYHGPQLFSDIQELCESEIERTLAAELIDLFCPCNPIDVLFVSAGHRELYKTAGLDDAKAFFEEWLTDTACYSMYGPRTRAAVFPQTRIGRMRVDFVVMAADQVTKPLRSMAAIECDGHEFHERTKEQAARDRRRDRALTAANIPFFRFTGSEIWKDAHACMLEIENFLWREMFGRECPLRQYDQDV